MVTTAITAFSPLRTFLGLSMVVRCRATAPLSCSRFFLPNASHRTAGFNPVAPTSALGTASKLSSAFASPQSPLLVHRGSNHSHSHLLKMREISSSNLGKDPLLPFAAPSNPGDTEAGDQTSDPASSASGQVLSPEEQRRQKLRDNMFKDGELGKRGEEYVAIQMLLFAGIAFPPDFLFSSLLPLTFFDPSDVWYFNYVIGAALFCIGGWFSSNAVKDLGTNLSPFPKPPTDSELETGGMYAVVRHPIYSGALLLATGLTLLTCSTGRGILTVLLLLLFDKKAAVEEGYLVDKYGRQYQEYKQKVKKLIPYLY